MANRTSELDELANEGALFTGMTIYRLYLRMRLHFPGGGDCKKDALAGFYHQAVMGKTFEMVFYRKQAE